MFVSLPFGTLLTFLLGLPSAVLIAVAFRYLATMSSFYFACFYFYFAVFSHCGYIAVSLFLFSLLGLPCRSSLLSAIFRSSCHFYCCAIFIAAVHFIALQPAIITTFHSRLDLSFVELPFLLWSYCRHIDFAAKDVFIVTTGRPLFFFAFLVVLVIFTPLYCSYSHCSTGSNSHTVVLCEPCILFSSIVYPRKKTRICLPIFYCFLRCGESTVVVQLQYVSRCGKSMITVRQKYTVSKANIR